MTPRHVRVGKDLWDKVRIGSTALAAVLVPFILATITIYSDLLFKNREAEVKLMELAVDILNTDPGRTDQVGVRNWAIDILQTYSGVRMSDEAVQEIRSGPLVTGQLVLSNEYFGPSDLNVWHYLPDGLVRPAPLVVALAGCSQEADEFAVDSGWIDVAANFGFVLAVPTSPPASPYNPKQCYQWWESDLKNVDSSKLSSMPC